MYVFPVQLVLKQKICDLIIKQNIYIFSSRINCQIFYVFDRTSKLTKNNEDFLITNDKNQLKFSSPFHKQIQDSINYNVKQSYFFKDNLLQLSLENRILTSQEQVIQDYQTNQSLEAQWTRALMTGVSFYQRNNKDFCKKLIDFQGKNQ